MTQEEIKEWGRRIAALRHQYEHACTVCGTVFRGIKTARYDTPACRQKALRDRRRSGSRPAAGEVE